MADPIGELEELVRQAFASGPETMRVEEAAAFLAERLAPLVVLRTQLEHGGWEGDRPYFFIPSRTVIATAHMTLLVDQGATRPEAAAGQ